MQVYSKYINAQQAKTIHSFKNIKEKLLKANAAIWFNIICNFKHAILEKYFEVYQQRYGTGEPR
jgi:hypothetical protein